MKTALPALGVIVFVQFGVIGYLVWGRADPCVTQRALEREYTVVLQPGDRGYRPPPAPPQPPVAEVFAPS